MFYQTIKEFEKRLPQERRIVEVEQQNGRVVVTLDNNLRVSFQDF